MSTGIDSARVRPLYQVKANLFKGMAHPARVRILELLAAGEPVAVSVLLEETGMEASHLSQHLAVLRGHHLVVSERHASQVLYTLAYEEIADLLIVARSLLASILETTQEQLALTSRLPVIEVINRHDTD